MIEIKKLTKIYKSSSRQSCKALDDISFKLPNKGMVFVVGKSGSGKSTLLNLLGGLDNATSGEIFIDNIKFSEMGGKESFDKFRNSYMGFVFQDYYLIDMLTVFENVKFALDLQHQIDDEKVYQTLKIVGLEGFENRYPKELSGGQQQRVAIARALVKNPSLILADEPTGNLDEVTSIQILDILKTLSKNSLVVIVSHNIDHAKQYGDRIIRLSEGKIESDKQRTSSTDELIVSENEILLPGGRSLTEEELDIVNDKVKHKKYKFSNQEEVFADSKPVKDEAQTNTPLSSSKLPLSKILKLSTKFTKSTLFTFIASTFIVSFLVVLFGLCQLLMSFSGNDLLKNVSGAYNDVYILQKGYYATSLTTVVSTDKMGMVTDEDLEILKNTSNDSDMFLLYNMPIPLNKNSSSIEMGNTINQVNAYQELYAKEAMGVIVCNEQYLARIYGQDGQVNLKWETPNKYAHGVYITDYMADCIVLHFSPELFDYDNRDNPYTWLVGWIANSKYYVNGIIDTGYKDRYAELIEAFNNAYESPSREEITKIYTSEIYSQFIEEARTSLNVAYATDESFLDAIIMNRYAFGQGSTFARLLCADFLDADGKILIANSNNKTCSIGVDLQDDEIVMDIAFYNSLFDKNINTEDLSDFEQKEITIEGFMTGRNPADKPEYSRKFTIVDVNNLSDTAFQVSEETYKFFRHYDFFPYAVIFDQPTDIAALYNVGEPRGFYSTSPQFSAVYTVVRVMTMYRDLFLIIALVLFFAGLLILFNFGRKIVRGRVYEIGIIRALGGRKIEIVKVFLFQLLFIASLICIISIAGLFGITALANSILSVSLVKVTQNASFKGMTLLIANPTIFAIIIGTVIIITILSALIPLVMLSRIKPLNIIKKKE